MQVIVHNTDMFRKTFSFLICDLPHSHADTAQLWSLTQDNTIWVVMTAKAHDEWGVVCPQASSENILIPFIGSF